MIDGKMAGILVFAEEPDGSVMATYSLQYHAKHWLIKGRYRDSIRRSLARHIHCVLYPEKYAGDDPSSNADHFDKWYDEVA